MEKIYRVQMNSKGMPNFSTAVEVSDRLQGEWIKVKNDGVWSYAEAYAECDQCHKVIFNGWKMNFCPNCGARMFAKDINVPNKKGADDETD